MSDRQFLQETNFEDEREVFKSDALQNFAKHYPPAKSDKIKEKYAQWKEPEGHDSY